jgi:hypothetical protein
MWRPATVDAATPSARPGCVMASPVPVRPDVSGCLDSGPIGGTVTAMSDPGAVPEAEMPSAEAALEADLSLFSQTPAFARGVRDALGASDPEDPLGVGSGLVYHLLRGDGQVLACYLLTASGFLMHEWSRSGDSLTVAVPAWRLARVETRRSGEDVVLTIEIDADRRGVRFDVDGDVRVGTVTPAFYVVNGHGVEGDAVAAFGAEMRCLLLGLWA